VVTGWSPAEPRRPESLLLARVGSDGSIEPAGSTPLVLADGQADEVRRQLEPLVLPPTRRGQRIRRLLRPPATPAASTAARSEPKRLATLLALGHLPRSAR
jgi:hypothetical protein